MRDIVVTMRWGALLLLAACSGGTGVDIDIFVPAEAHVDRVELWVAYDECYDCPSGIGWTDGERASGDIYFLRDETVIKAVQHGDRWVVHLDASAGFTDPPWLALAGFTGDQVTAVKVLRNVRIPVGSVVTWQAYLHPAEPATTDLVTPPASLELDHRAHVWAREPTVDLAEPTGCLAYQRWNGERAAWETEYFVPKSDPDCDGVRTELECSEYWFNYRPGVSGCVRDASTVLPNTCVAGTSLCADGLSSDGVCRLELSSSPLTCLVDAACVECADDLPADGCVKNAIEAGIASDTTPHYHCDFDSTMTGTGCPGQYMLLQLPFSTAPCGPVKLRYLDRPFELGVDELRFGVVPDQATFAVTPDPTVACRVQLEWKGGTIEAFKDGVVFLLDMAYDNSTHALYPIELKATNTTIACTSTVFGSCTPGGPSNDGVVNCSLR